MKQTSAIKHLSRRKMPRHERGAATILTVLLIGIGLVSASMGAMHMVRSTQERQLAAHAQVNSQSGVWSTVEVVRVYLQSLNQTQLTTLATPQVWTITGNDSLTQQATLVRIDPPVAPATAYKVTAKLSATDIAARSSSSLEVVYEVNPANPPGNITLNGVLDFYNDLNLGGGITLNVPNGASFNVDGDFTANNVGITGVGLNRIAVTGNVIIGSDVDARELWGRNVTITGGATAKNIYAFGTPTAEGGIGDATSSNRGDTCCGNITTSGGVTGIESMNANGEVQSGGTSRLISRNPDVYTFAAQQIKARGNVAINGGGSVHGTISAGGSVKAVDGHSVTSLASVGNVTLGGNSVDAVVTRSSVVCTANWKVFTSIKAAGSVTGCHPSSGIEILNPPPAVDVMESLDEVRLVQPRVDAWTLRAAANYALEIDGTKTKVTVQNIQGMTNGTYYLGTFNGKPREYLCNTVDANNRCTLPATRQDAHPFCNSYSASEDNGCFTITTTPGQEKWSIAGKSLPPGVMWFKGDLTLNSGIYYNTFIVTGDIATGGQLVTYALNYAGYGPICNNQFDTGVRSNDFAGMRPSNYCVNGAYVGNALGNIGLLAGGYAPASTANQTTPAPYSGGLIELGAGNAIYGTVLSGDLLKTGGSTRIYGYISAAGLQQSDDINNLGGSTLLDLMNLPAGYNPNEIPNMNDPTSGSAGTATVLWTRYL